MRLLLDTHVLLWWLAGDGALLPPQIAALDAAETRNEPLGVAAITLWEIAKLCEHGRIALSTTPDSLFDHIENHALLDVIPIDGRIALESTRLGPRFHRDPADQLIAATARVHGLRLVTADQRIRASGVVPVV